MSTPTYRLVRTARPETPPPTLDAAQRRVVEHAGGPLLVLAGPGTGKTTTLVETVAARVAAGVPVEQLLMLTFSRRAAGEMRDRVAARLQQTIREPVARTLHSYAFGVLRMAAANRGDPTPRLLAAAEQDVVIRELLAEGDPERWPVALRPALRTLGFATELRDLVMRAVERGLDGPSLSELGRRRNRADWVAAGEFLTEYQGVTVLRDPDGFDPAELIQGAIAVLHDEPELLAAERERRRRIFVDEYQDTDPAQAELLALLSDGADELVLVGDPDQSIYAFRGADEGAIRQVDERFGQGTPVPVVALTTCRRSGGTLVAATRRVAQRLPGRGEQRALVPAEGDPGQVSVAVFRTASEEAAYLAGRLRAAHLEGMSWSRMAVLVRSTSRTLGTLRRAMITAGVPVTVRGDDLPLIEQPAVVMLLRALTCVDDPARLTEDVAESLLVGPVGGGDAMYLRRLRRALRRIPVEQPDPSEPDPAQSDATEPVPDDTAPLLAVLLDAGGAITLPEAVRRPVENVGRVLAAGTKAAAGGGSVEQILWAIWDASRLARRWERASATGGVAGAAADRDLDAVVELFAAVAAFTDRLPGARPGEFDLHLRAQQLPGGTMASAEPDQDAVAVLTAHASKGLEWDLVCVAAVQEGTWPDLRRRGSLLGAEALIDALNGLDDGPLASLTPQLAEERRLFYVAATRARLELVVTAVAGDEEQPSRLLDELDPIDGPRPLERPLRGVHLPGLVAELRAVVCADSTASDVRSAAADQLARLADAGVRGADPGQWWGVSALTTDTGTVDPDRPVRVSPSRVELFLTCELRALLLGFGAGERAGAAADLGTIIHDIAEHAPVDASLDELERRLDERWPELDFGAAWFTANQRRRATEMLKRLIDWLRNTRADLDFVAAEADFEVTVGDAVLAGRADRLERDKDGRLVVIDFKTGSTPAKDIEHNPQLGAYQLAIEQGAFADVADDGSAGSGEPGSGELRGAQPGGGQLVQLGAKNKGVAQVQRPLGDADDPTWVRTAVEAIASRLRGAEFTARVNERCRACDVRASCPVEPTGRQVTQ